MGLDTAILCMSRIIERRFVLGDAEKERLLNRMRQLAAFGGIKILAYSFLSNHFHVLAYVPEICAGTGKGGGCGRACDPAGI